MARAVVTLLAFLAVVIVTISASENPDQGTGTVPDLSSFNKAQQDKTPDEGRKAAINVSSAANIPAQATDDQNVEDYRSFPGAFVRYYPALNPDADPPILRRATGVDALFTLDILRAARQGRLGSGAYGPIDRPPGFQDLIDNHDEPSRGHLLAKSLGGSGVLVTNIVTLHSFVNGRQMEEWERRAANAYAAGTASDKCLIEYQVRAHYVQGRLEPDAISIRAAVINPLVDRRGQRIPWFYVLFFNINPAEPVMIRHWDEDLMVEC